MTEFRLIDTNREREKSFNTRAEAEEKKQDMIGLGASPEDLEIVSDASDGSQQEDVATNGQAEKTHTDGGQAATVVQEPTDEPIEPEKLSKNPIQFLEAVNTEFVNTIKGTPAISKRGFRFIQREFEISTESEVVQWIDDPMGCIVWAKAELPSGYSAEAHGEGYITESQVDDNEFVRYADTRAKNRAISDLTSAGALAVSELQE